MKIEVDDGKLCWIPKTVIYNGKIYPAPLNLLPILTRQVIIEYLTEKKKVN
jgi:hypothetical protein